MTMPHPLNSHRWAGLRIGLLGGSFNPPHAGHMHAAQLSLLRLNLDFVWWLVTPQNPLKTEIVSHESRFQAVEKITACNPRFIATDIERKLGTGSSFETVKKLKSLFPATDFVWLCGMDNALIFDRWDHWRDLIREIPLAFAARPPALSLVRGCRLRMLSVKNRFLSGGRLVALETPAVYWMLENQMVDIASSDIRAKG